MLSTLKIEEVSQKCFVFDVVKFKAEEVSQTCCIFDAVKFKIVEEVSQNSSGFKLAERKKER